MAERRLLGDAPRLYLGPPLVTIMELRGAIDADPYWSQVFSGLYEMFIQDYGFQPLDAWTWSLMRLYYGGLRCEGGSLTFVEAGLG